MLLPKKRIWAYLLLLTITFLGVTHSKNTNAQVYCAPNMSSTWGIISDVSTSGASVNITGNATGFAASGYTDYSASHQVTVTKGDSFNLNISATWTSHVYVDWNQDLDFLDPGEYLGNKAHGTGSPSTQVFNVVPPSSATGGQAYRLRIYNHWQTTVTNPCNNGNGEAEDYTIRLSLYNSAKPELMTPNVTDSVICDVGKDVQMRVRNMGFLNLDSVTIGGSIRKKSGGPPITIPDTLYVPPTGDTLKTGQLSDTINLYNYASGFDIGDTLLVWTRNPNGVIKDTLDTDDTLRVVIPPPDTSSSSRIDTVCTSFTSPSGKIYTVSGSYVDTFTNAKGCDSLIFMNLTIRQPSTSTISPVVCNTYTSPSGKVRTSSGSFNDTISNAIGCDSVITINLTVNHSTSATVNAAGCLSYTSPSGKVWTTSNTYLDTINNSKGCDSIITINLSMNVGSSSTISPVACDSYTSPSGKVWTTSNTYMDTINNYLGCDSVITVNLTIKSSSSSTISPVACDRYTSPSGKVWTTSNTYSDTIRNSVGCDSVITVNLTINRSSTASINRTVCDSFVSPSGKVWTTTNVYTDTIRNAVGCDSIITIGLTVNNSSTSSISPVVCDSYTSPSGKIWTTSNTYMDTIRNSVGCDSVITISLTVNLSTSDTISATVCDRYTSPSGKIWTASNTYVDTIRNGVGCDSIITIQLTVDSTTVSTISPVVCHTYTSPSGKVWTASNTYTDTIANNKGCDSIITINLTVNPLPKVGFVAPTGICENTPIFKLSGGSPTGGIYSGKGVSVGNYNPGSVGIGGHTLVYTFTDSNNCTDSASATIRINAVTLVTLNYLGYSCENHDDIQMVGFASPKGGVFTGPGISGNSFVPKVAGVGSHKITYSYTNSENCSDSSARNLIVEAIPVFQITGDTIGCGTSEKAPVLRSSVKGLTYRWSNGSRADSTIVKRDGKVWLKVTDHSTQKLCWNSDTINVKYEAECVGLDEVWESATVRYFPNPTQGMLNYLIQGIESSTVNMVVVNVSGQVVLERELQHVGGVYEGVVNLENVDSGLYFIHLKSAKGTITHRIQVSK